MIMATSVSCLHKLSEQGTRILQVFDTESPNEGNTEEITRGVCCILLKHVAEAALA